jgi:hypothetical protein
MRSILDDLTGSIDHLDTVELPPMRKSGPGTPPSLAAERVRQQIAEDFMNMWFATRGERGSTKRIVSELCRRHGLFDLSYSGA